MTIDQVMLLVEKGFTRDDIMQLTGTAQQETSVPDEPAQEQTSDQDPEPVQEPEKKPEPEKKQEPNETDKRLAGIENNISALIKTIQTSNLLNNSHGGNEKSLDDMTDSIMASIIRPETGKEQK